MKFISQMGSKSRVYAVTSLSYHKTNKQATAEGVLATKQVVLLLLMTLMMMTVNFTDSQKLSLSGKTEPQLIKSFCQIGLQACMWHFFWIKDWCGKAYLTVGGATSDYDEP